MKKLFILLLIIPILGFSQNDLVFNQVSIVVLDFNGITVPDGKVWKIESADGQYLLVDDDNWELGRLGSYNNMPAWFPEGTILKKGSGSSTGSSPISRLSVLEFYVVAASSSSGSGSSSGSSGSGFSSSTPGDDFTDQSGNSFNSTNTGDLTWSTSNASHTTYRDGTPIPQITNEEDWNAATTGAWCYLFYDETNASYGKLYNYFAVVGENDTDPNTTPKIFAPTGWHVPAFAEWDNLFTQNSGNANFQPGTSSLISFWEGIGFGGKMKSQTGWNSGYNGTNSSGMDIKPYTWMGAGEDEAPTANAGAGFELGMFTAFWTKDRRNQSSAYAIAFGYSYEGAEYYSNNRVYSWSANIRSSTTSYNGALYARLVKDY